MDYSDEIEEESPCFIVPDSQNNAETTAQRCDSTKNGSLKELAMLSPANINVENAPSDIITRSHDQEKVDRDPTKTDSSGSDRSSQCQAEKGASSSSETSVYPNSTSSSDSSKDEFHQKSQQKLHAVKSLLTNEVLRRAVSSIHEASSSSQDDLFPTFTQEITNSSEAFQCLQLSGDVKEQETSSSCDFIPPSNKRHLRPTSPSTESTESDSPSLEGQKQGSIDEHQTTSRGAERGDSEETSVAFESNAVNEHRREETGLPKWQRDCLHQESEPRSQSRKCGIVTLSRTTSENSTCGTDTASSLEDEVPSLHQWQPQNGNLSDELYDNEQSTPESPSGGDLQVPELPKSSQTQHPKGLELPEMSQDIFHPKTKRASDEQNKEPSPTDNDVIILPSQEEFRLHFTQSQSNSPPTCVAVGPKMGDDRQCQSESHSVRSSQNLSLSQSILPQISTRRSTPAEHNQTQQQDGLGVFTKASNDKAVTNLPERDEDAIVVRPSSSAPLTTDVIEHMTESAESSQVAFHFSPPTVLLRPMMNITPSPCFEMSSESQKEILNEPSPQEICSTSEFEPAVLPNVVTKTLSLSAPNRCDDNTDHEEADSSEIGFNLRKIDFVPDTERTKIVGKPVRSVFTNVRERFQAADGNRATAVEEEEPDPFEFVDEISGSPSREIRAAKRKRGDLGELGGKRKKTNEISESIELDDSESRNTPKRKFWKIVKTRTITTTTTMVERETFVKYADGEGNVVSHETTHEFGEPSYVTRSVEGEETREEVEEVPSCGNISTSTTEKCSIAARQRARRESCEVSARSEANLREGSRVLALWFDKHYYPGTLKSRNVGDSSSRKCRVEFDDGDLRDILERDMLAVDYLPRDQPVMVREQHGDCYDNGVIRGFYQAGHARGYKVEKEDGRVQNCPRSRVILNVEQATIFLSLRSSLSTNDSLTNEPEPFKSPRFSESFTSPDRSNDVRSSPRTRSADRANASETANASRVSCNKTAKASRRCDGKAPSVSRTSRDNAAKTSTTSSDRAATTSRTSPDGDTKRKNARRLSSSDTPKSSHKSTLRKLGKKGGTRDDNCGNEDEGRPVGQVRRRLSCAMQATELDKTRAVPTRTSPRKCATRGDTQGNEEPLVLPSNRDLFRGYGFVITGTNDVPCLDDRDSPGEEDRTFDRGQVRRQIEVGGGVVLSTFHEGSGEDNASYLLISNKCKTTAKYFHALVAGVPCLSHLWLRDCCEANKLINYENYLLPAGEDRVTGRLVEKQEPTNALRDFKVYLVGDSEFVEEWKKVLGAAKCHIINKLPANVLKELQCGNEEFKCDAIIVGSGHVPHSTIRKARLLAVPTVTIQWVKECILTGKLVSFDAHPSFRYAVLGNE